MDGEDVDGAWATARPAAKTIAVVVRLVRRNLAAKELLTARAIADVSFEFAPPGRIVFAQILQGRQGPQRYHGLPTFMSAFPFRGVFTALVTPFRDGALDEAAFVALVERQIAAGVHGLVPVGTTGETATLSHAEHRRVVSCA